MRIDVFNFKGDFKAVTDQGNIRTYYIGDVVTMKVRHMLHLR